MRRAELAVAAAWFALGALIAGASWRMDRLADRGIERWSAPGLTPGVVGLLVMAFAVAVGWQAWRAPRDLAEPEADPGDAADARRVVGRTALAGALCIAFAATLGQGLPFLVTGIAFVFAFTAVFSWAGWRSEGRLVRGTATALAVAAVATVAIALLFERVFLVRLP